MGVWYWGFDQQEDDGDDVEGQALLSERRQEPLGDAMEQMLTKKGVKSLVTAIKKGASINSPFTDGRGFDRLVRTHWWHALPSPPGCHATKEPCHASFRHVVYMHHQVT